MFLTVWHSYDITFSKGFICTIASQIFLDADLIHVGAM